MEKKMKFKQIEFDDTDCNGRVELYEVTPKFEGFQFIAISTVSNHYGLLGMGDYFEETAIFGSDESGEEIDWSNPLWTTGPVEDHGTVCLAFHYLNNL